MSQMDVAIKAKQEQILFKKASEEDRNKAILNIAQTLENNISEIIKVNQMDLIEGRKNNLSDALLDRLELNETRIKGIIESVKNIANQDQVVGEIVESFTREDGLKIEKQRIPLGVIGMIFESRPNVVIDCSCLAIKSGNCIILKGGKEAKESNRLLTLLVQNAIEPYIPKNVVQLIDSRDEVGQLLNQVGLVDVIIPRGGERLIEYVYENSKIPVIAHFKGLCHLYIDETANLDQALEIVMNAKTQRPGVCNAIETLLYHKSLPDEFIDKMINSLSQESIEIRTCAHTQFRHPALKRATDEDWSTEYLDKILSMKAVENVDEAILHIQKFGSHHTEAILSDTQENIEKFQNQIDASSIMVNASTRFNDGGEYGLGAELGISTTKLHAYGPMGAREMTTLRFLVTGQGHIRK